MKGFHSPLLIFAVRDARRRPAESWLSALALATLTFVAAVPLLVQEGLANTATRELASGPSLVIRRLDPGGFAPIPVDEGLAALRSVRGITKARARLQGVVAGPDAPVTIMGVDAATARTLADEGIATPAPGEAVAGSALASFQLGSPLRLRGTEAQRERVFRLVAVLPAGSDAVPHDLVLVTWDNAAELLGVSSLGRRATWPVGSTRIPRSRRSATTWRAPFPGQ